QREPDWPALRELIARSVAEDPTSEIAVLAQRAAATVKVEVSRPLSSLEDPASLGIDPRARFPIEDLHYLVTVEGSLDGGAWKALGWADYPDGGCGTVITSIFSQAELRPGLHRLDLRATFVLANSRDHHHTPCGFQTPGDTLKRADAWPDFSELNGLFKE